MSVSSQNTKGGTSKDYRRILKYLKILQESGLSHNMGQWVVYTDNS